MPGPAGRGTAPPACSTGSSCCPCPRPGSTSTPCPAPAARSPSATCTCASSWSPRLNRNDPAVGPLSGGFVRLALIPGEGGQGQADDGRARDGEQAAGQRADDG